jgi:hypothetical protein
MGRKVALCVGQNEYGPSTGVTPLRGCVNDALLIGEMLRAAGFEVRQIHNQAATQKGIVDRLETEVAKLRAGDYLVFWNSSHGYQLTDRSADELYDGRDEAICTYDTDPRDPLMDDKLAKLFSRANPEAFVFFGSDSCHSGTLTRDALGGLRENGERAYRAPRLWLPPEDVRARAGQPAFDLWGYFDEEKRPEYLAANGQPLRAFGRLGHPPPEVPHVLLAGCRAEQVSWDAQFGGRFHGAMTYNFAKAVLAAWRQGRAITYRDAHARAVAMVQERFAQEPQLEGPDSMKDAPVFGYRP